MQLLLAGDKWELRITKYTKNTLYNVRATCCSECTSGLHKSSHLILCLNQLCLCCVMTLPEFAANYPNCNIFFETHKDYQ
jgi:hypothetical protein